MSLDDEELIGSVFEDGPLFWAMVDANNLFNRSNAAKMSLATRTKHALMRKGCQTIGDVRRIVETGNLDFIGQHGEDVLRAALGMEPLERRKPPDPIQRAADRLTAAGWTVRPPEAP